MKIDFSILFKRKKGIKDTTHCYISLISNTLGNFHELKFFNWLILFNMFFISFSITAQNDVTVKKESTITTETYLSTEINSPLNRNVIESNSVNYVPTPPVIGIVQSGTTSQCNPSTVQLCSTTGTIYALNAFPLGANSIAKYGANFSTDTLVKDNTFTGTNAFNVNYGMDRNPLTGIVYLISGDGQGVQRKLYTINLATNAITNKGPVISTTGNNQVQDFTFDSSGNMYAVFNTGIIQRINYNSPALTPTAFASGLPTSGGVGLTFDFDANRLIYATGVNATKELWQISNSGIISFMFNMPTNMAITAQGIEYVGRNSCYVTSTDSTDLIFRINLNTQEVNSVMNPTNFVSEIKDLMYVPLALQWSFNSNNLGNTECINVSPTATSTYLLTATNEFGVSATAPHTVTVSTLPCGNSIVNLKLFIEGYYAGNQMMRSVKNNQDGISPLTDVEDITVELHDATFPYATVATTIALLRTNGVAVCSFPTGPSGSFYIAVRTRNTTQTWSATPQLVGTVALNYDFSTASNSAYGNNMKNLGVGVFGFFSGDINRDDVIDGTDATFLDLDIYNSDYGIKATDLNGDGTVDGSDAVIFDINSFNSVYSYFPI